MSLTFIDTNKLPRVNTPSGAMTEILNEKLAGAKNIVTTVRWLNSGQTYDARATEKHQLIYLMDGEATITLAGKEYQVKKGAGVYLGPSETATVTAQAGASAKLLQLVVPQIPK